MESTSTFSTHAALDQDGAAATPGEAGASLVAYAGYLAVGAGLGLFFVGSEVLSWYRIQEMFRFQSFHMFGIIGVAVAVAALSQLVFRQVGARTLAGHPVAVPAKACTPSGVRYWGGGFFFGLGWALLGACPGPIFTLIGAGYTVYVVPLAAAVAGTYAYAALQRRLPH